MNDEEFSAIKLTTSCKSKEDKEDENFSTDFQSSLKVNESFSNIREIFSG